MERGLRAVGVQDPGAGLVGVDPLLMCIKEHSSNNNNNNDSDLEILNNHIMSSSSSSRFGICISSFSVSSSSYI